VRVPRNPCSHLLAPPLLMARMPLVPLQCKRMLSIGARKSAIEKELNAKQATGARDALAKAIYEKLFSWIVSIVNDSLAVFRDSTGLCAPESGCDGDCFCWQLCPRVILSVVSGLGAPACHPVNPPPPPPPPRVPPPPQALSAFWTSLGSRFS
jgi:hypothetical protein